MKRFARITRSFMLAALLVGGLAACDTTSSALTDDEAVDPAGLNEIAATLTTQLNLSAEQARSLNRLFEDDDHRTPGSLWTVAAELQQTLSDEQKQRLLERAAERPQRRMRRGGQDGAPDGARRFEGRRQGPRGAGDLLTDEQKAALAEFMEGQKAQRQALREARQNGTLSDEDFRAEMKTLREATKAFFENLLTDEQKATLEQRREERQARRTEQREEAKAARTEALGLTAEQEAALDALHEQHAEALRQRREALRAGNADRIALREALQELRAEHKEALAALLTPTQLEIVEIHHALRRLVAKGRHGGPRHARRAGRAN